MNYNQAYAKAHAFLQRFWYIRNTFGMGDSILTGYMNNKFQPMRDKLYIETYQQLYPNRKKPNIKTVIKKLPDPLKAEIDGLVIQRGTKYAKHLIATFYRLDDLLNIWCHKVDLTETEWETVKTSDVGTFNSQGIGRNRYAKNALSSSMNMLRTAGYECRIEPYYWGEKGYVDSGKELAGYALKAKLNEWQFDALWRKSNMTQLEWAVDCWRNGTNPKVYAPFLPDDVYYMSEKLAFEQG